MRTPLHLFATIGVLALAIGDAIFADNGNDGDIRTFEFLAHRVSVLSTDDDALLFDRSAEQYFAELRAQQERGENGPPPRIEWVAAYDGLVWGSGENNLAGQWYGQRKPEDDHYFTFFKNDDRKKKDFKFPAATRYMGITERFVWHGWAWTVLDFYASEHEAEFPHIWINLALAQQIFLSGASPDEAFERFSRPPGLEGTTEQSQRVLPDGRVRREITFKPRGGRFEVTLRIDSAGPDRERQPATWRYVQKSFARNESLLFMAEWRETTATSQRSLPALPKDTPASHHDVQRIDSVGVRDRTGLGLWPDREVEYLKVTPGVVAVRDWFSSARGRWLTNGVVLITLLSLLWREGLSHQAKEIGQ